MPEESLLLKANNTWTILLFPLEIVKKADGSMEHYKAWFVAKGYNQLEGLGYTNNFAPVVKLTTLHLLLALTASNNWILK